MGAVLRRPLPQTTACHPCDRLTVLRSGFLGWSSVVLVALGPGGLGCGQSESGGGGGGAPPGSDCRPVGAEEVCYPGEASTRDIGECKDGTRACQAGGWSECIGAVLPTEEVCGDLLDDDCDGASDDGCPCETGATRPCYSGPSVTRGIGVCVDGEQLCQAEAWGSECVGEALPGTEDPCNDLDDDCDGVAEDGRSCEGKVCGADDGCGAPCQQGSGCCAPACSGKLCGAADGCGGTCQQGSGCCTPVCSGKLCGAADGCGGTCQQGSGCCTPVCSGKLCGAGDGCGGTCTQGSGCCTPSCNGASCGGSDGCGGECSGSCPWGYFCNGSLDCVCGPAPSFQLVGGTCRPSCGALLDHLGLPDTGGGCCPSGCVAGTFAGGPGSTHDCTYCCASPQQGVSSCW